MSSRANSAALRREMEARFAAQGLVLEQIMNRLDAMAEPAPPVPNEQNMPEPAAANPPVPPAVPVAAPAAPIAAHVGELIYERFGRQKPPQFDGSRNPVEAEDWIKRLQRIFDYMRLEDHERVACAVHQLEKDGLCWWEITAQCEGTENISWERFKILFKAKYLGEANIASKV